MPETITLFIKPSLFQKEKKIIIEPDLLEYGNLNFSKLEIEGLRYGVKGIRGYIFWIGKLYCIDIKNVDGAIIKIRLRTFYKIRRKKIEDKYALILNAIIKNFIDNIYNGLLKQFNDKIDFELLGTTFTQQGIGINKTGKTILWQDLATKQYWKYFSIFSKTDPANNASFYHLEEWNTVLMAGLVSNILSSKKLM